MSTDPDKVPSAAEANEAARVDVSHAAGVDVGAAANDNVSPNADEEANAQLVLLLANLRSAGAEGLSLARISKRCQLPMSTLRRLLSGLEEAGILTFTVNETGRGNATLTAEGRGLADALKDGVSDASATPDASS